MAREYQSQQKHMPKRPFISKVQNFMSTPSSRGNSGAAPRQFVVKSSGQPIGPLFKGRPEKKQETKTLPTSTRQANKMQFQQTQPLKLMSLRSKDGNGGGSQRQLRPLK